MFHDGIPVHPGYGWLSGTRYATCLIVVIHTTSPECGLEHFGILCHHTDQGTSDNADGVYSKGSLVLKNNFTVISNIIYNIRLHLNFIEMVKKLATFIRR